ncbi:MAG TPA: M23 family metallopeptidase [Stellaceae bacterium]|nr:M23 family metallopeptidase [Stellaceae bacterium]
MRRIWPAAALLLALGSRGLPARADDAIAISGVLSQGGLARGEAPPGTALALDSRPVRVAPDGRFILGFGRDAPAKVTLSATFPDGHSTTQEITLGQREYDVQRINGLPPLMVTPDSTLMVRIKAELAKVHGARAIDSDQLAFETPLEWPVTGPISGVYGSQRILNGEPRAPHLGVDIAAPTGTPIKADAAGTVTLAEHDLYFTGGTVIIDHGYGLSSIYQHMSRLDVTVGQHVEQGETVGAIGATGRVTGAHLHWGMNWYDVAIDPQLIAGPMPK